MLAQTVQLDQEALTEVEERSESLANALLDLSVAVRQTDFRVLQEFFSPQVQAKRFPNFPSAGAPSSKWISRRHLEFAATQALSMERDDFLQQWRGFLAGFSQIEDARFKVQDARFSEEPTGTLGEGKIKFFLVGRDRTDKRCWIRGTGSIEARQGDGGTWQISEWILDQMRWSLADVDLFPEVSLPAGVSVSLPRYGSPGNDDFVYHGAAAGDLNADGLIDIVATGILHNYVYLNRGDGTFKEVSSGVGLPPTPQASGCLLLDFDNDKDLDLFFSAVGHQMLFENRWVPDGKLLFSDVSLEAGVALPAVGFSATAGDVNSDGWPDLYVASYNRYGRIMPNSWHQATNGTLNLLFVNQKDGTFKESAKSWGVQDRRWSYAAQFADLNNDHRLDLYVANDFGENALFGAATIQRVRPSLSISSIDQRWSVKPGGVDEAAGRGLVSECPKGEARRDMTGRTKRRTQGTNSRGRIVGGPPSSVGHSNLTWNQPYTSDDDRGKVRCSFFFKIIVPLLVLCAIV